MYLYPKKSLFSREGFRKFTLEKAKIVSEKKIKSCAPEAHKMLEIKLVLFLLCRYILNKISSLGTGYYQVFYAFQLEKYQKLYL